MKHLNTILLALLISFTSVQYAQNLNCVTKAKPTVLARGASIDQIHQKHHTFNTNLCIKVRLNSVKDENDHFSQIILNNQVSLLNNYFEGNITFILDGINYYNYNQVANGDLIVENNQGGFDANFNALVDIENQTSDETLDIFLFNKELGASFAQGIASESRVFITQSHISTTVLAHEVGHAFGLFHTYHSTMGNGTNSIGENDDEFEDSLGHSLHEPECADLNDQYRGSKGDYVYDTIADPNHATVTSCDFINAEDFQDYCPDSNLYYSDPDITNYMRSSGQIDIDLSPCWTHFTEGQFSRMNYYVSTFFGDLIDSSICPTDPDCQWGHCKQSRQLAREIFYGPHDLGAQSYVDYTSETTATIYDISQALIDLELACNIELYVSWDGLPFVLLTPEGLDITFNTTSELTLKIVNHDASAGAQECCFIRDKNSTDPGLDKLMNVVICPTDTLDDCEDCEDIVSEIIASLQPTSQDGCTWSMTIPEISDCMYGTKIDWSDGGTDGFESNSVISHTYSDSGTYNVRVILQQFIGQDACEADQTIDVSCQNDDCNPCPLEPPTFESESASFPGCGTMFNVDNFDFGCADSDLYTFEWEFDGEVVGYGERFEYQGTRFGWVKVALNVIFESSSYVCYASTPDLPVYLFSPCSRSISVYPNPSKPNSELQFDGIDAIDIQSIEILDLFGNSKMKIRPSQNSFKIPQLQSGLYIVTFYTSKGIEQKKLIIE